MLRKRLAWLLWFALLLPFAQVTAAAHELSHVEVAQKVVKASMQCEVCQLAAAVGSGGAPSTPQVFTGSTLPNISIASQPPVFIAADAPSFFQSRAPPLVLKS